MMFTSRHALGAAALCAALACSACNGSGPGPDAAPPQTVPSAQGQRFTDPQGAYSMVVGADWTPLDAPPSSVYRGAEFWRIAQPSNGFAPNVNVISETNDLGEDLERLADLVAGSLRDALDATILSNQVVTNADGARLILLEYSSQAAEPPLHFLAAISVSNASTNTATFAAPNAEFTSLRSAIEPHLLSLQSS